VPGLEKKGLIRRFRCPDDRRAMRASLTPPGEGMLDAIREPLNDLHRRQLGHLSAPRLK
jgi:DNA-binding MarR family transcriptional regulator